MASEAKVSLRARLSDLGVPVELVGNFSADPLYAKYEYLKQTTTNVAQVLNLGGVTTPDFIIIFARDNALSIDTSYTSSFSAEITLSEGEFTVFKPAGTVYIKNTTNDELCTVEYLVVGD
jgi:hypothetical protein